MSALMIWRIENPKGGVPEAEFVQLFALEDINLSSYALVDRTFDDDDRLSNEFRHIFVFPGISVDAGDTIYIHTGTGTNRSFIAEGGSTVHILFWGADHCVWNDQGGDRVTIIKYSIETSEQVPIAK